jgi:hypothetical protein
MSMSWLEEREACPRDRDLTEKALLELYTVLKLEPPRTVVWLDSPFQGLLADAILHHRHGDSLFWGDEPRMFMALMVGHSRWTRTLDGNYFPDPAWKDVPAGQRLRSRAAVMRVALQKKYAERIASQGPPSRDLERLLEKWPDAGTVEELREGLPDWLATLFAPTGNHRAVLPLAFAFDSKIASGDSFTLNSPRCMNLDEIAANVYAVENLSRKLPDWFFPLRDLAAGAGWVWPYDHMALLCPPPLDSHYDDENRLHCARGPAMRYLGEGAIHALQGEWVKPEATDLAAITPALVQAEPDLKKKRLLLEQLGPGIIDDPTWPEPLRQLSRMVYERQYRRFTSDDLSSRIAPWPPGLQEPRSQTSPEPSAAPPPDGAYYATYPCGQLRVVATAKGGEVERWLWLGEGVAAGYLKENGPFAEQYYPDGRIEGFSPYDDTSPPELTEMPFAVWVGGVINDIVPGGLTSQTQPPPPPPPPPRPRPRPAEPVSAKTVRPELREILSTLAVQYDGFFSTRWNLRRLLREELRLPAELVHGLGCYGVAACRRLLAPLEQRCEEVYLRPRWDRPEAPTEMVPLDTVEIYRRVKEAAQAEIERAEKHGKTPLWVKNLAQPSPVKREGEGKLPVPIEWLPADRCLDPFWICQVGCQMALRQEATRATELAEYLRDVDSERFFEAAGLAGAFLQSSVVVPDGLPDPTLDPPGSRLEDVEDLVAHLRTEPRLPLLRGETFPSPAPFLHSLGCWVHGRARGAAPTHSQMEIVSRLGSFFNLRGDNFSWTLSSLVHGEEYWELSSPVQGWPQRYQGPRSEPDWTRLGAQVRTRAARFFRRAGLGSLDEERVQAAFVFLASGGQAAEPTGLALRLEQPRPCASFPRAGEGYLKLLEAARWALEPVRKGDEKLAMALANHLLGKF